jgi:adenylosuccinate lyase
MHGGENDLLERLSGDSAFREVDVAAMAGPEQYVGRAPEQVAEFLEKIIAPIRERHAADLKGEAEVRV